MYGSRVEKWQKSKRVHRIPILQQGQQPRNVTSISVTMDRSQHRLRRPTEQETPAGNLRLLLDIPSLRCPQPQLKWQLKVLKMFFPKFRIT